MSTIHEHAQRRALLDRDAFLAELAAAGVLVRLDERGGKDEPAPWAFHGGDRPLSEILNEADTISSEEDDDPDVALPPRSRPPWMPVGRAGDDDPTVTSMAPPLAIPPARGAATVHVLRPPKPRAVFDVVIGRADVCDVVIPERSVSKRHAKVIVKDAGKVFAIVDVGSSNGVAVNGRRAQVGEPVPVRSGDVVELGDVALLFLDPAGYWDHLPRMAE